MKTYTASDLFEVSVSGSFPLDVEFILMNKWKFDDDLSGKGIYAIYYKDELLYIGSHFGGANVAAVRWQNELQTHSMRGSDVGFTSAACAALQGTQLMRSANFPVRTVDTGYLSSKNRVVFAEENWQLLSQEPSKWLSNFSFCWMPVSPKLKRSKKDLQSLTNQLRKFYKPRCNG